MRMLMAIVFGCSLMIGVNAASSGTTGPGGQPPAQGATSADRSEADYAGSIVIEDLAELVTGVGQDARRSVLVGHVEEEVALDRDVMGAEGVGGDRGGELKHAQRTERRLGVQVAGRRHADRPAAGR